MNRQALLVRSSQLSALFSGYSLVQWLPSLSLLRSQSLLHKVLLPLLGMSSFHCYNHNLSFTYIFLGIQPSAILPTACARLDPERPSSSPTTRNPYSRPTVLTVSTTRSPSVVPLALLRRLQRRSLRRSLALSPTLSLASPATLLMSSPTSTSGRRSMTSRSLTLLRTSLSREKRLSHLALASSSQVRTRSTRLLISY